MHMNERKYPISLFVIGFVTNMMFHFFWLFIPAIILLMVGIWVKKCVYFGLVLLALDVILSLLEQLKIRNAVLQESDNPDFRAFQEALSKDGNWTENIRELVEKTANK